MGGKLLLMMSRRARRARIEVLLGQLCQWEREGRNILAELVELTDPGEALAVECHRALELLDG